MSVLTPKRVIGVILLNRSGDVLFQHRDDKPGLIYSNQWTFPGGHCEEGEDFAVCARREFHEETNYDCRDLRLLKIMLVNHPKTAAPHELAIFWDIYDEAQNLICLEGQEIKFLERNKTQDYDIPEYLFPLWDSAFQKFNLALQSKPNAVHKISTNI
jgi:8-oxo-dGTP diphosphatase